MDEIIVVVPRKALFDYERLVFEGTLTDADKVIQLDNNISKNMGTMRRGDAEENTAFKQPIPYALLMRGDEIFAYERLEGGGEERLHGSISIGVGGHMNLSEGTPKDFKSILIDNLNRELDEEVFIISRSQELSVIGYINDDNDATNQVHIGVLVVIKLDDDATVSVKETDELDGAFRTIAELKESYDRLEDWTKIAIDYLESKGE